MLRALVTGLGLIMLAAGLLPWRPGPAPHVGVIVFGILLLVGTLGERVIYKRELKAPPGSGWEPTGEVSVTETGRVAVWYNPRTGERAYVRAD
jgi:hypothetical protein